MPNIKYTEYRFNKYSLAKIKLANGIIAEYSKMGFTLTLRQLYYQFVSRDLIKNNLKEYKSLGFVLSRARLAGLIDWLAIEDRTRNLLSVPNWSDPSSIIESAASSYHLDLWQDQEYRPEIWIEKDALVGVFERTANQYDVPLFSCRGYNSQSEMWRAAMRIKQYQEDGQQPIILHFGDHDPSGIDMSRDIKERMKVFGVNLEFKRIALNMPQVRKFKPPPNPAKETDARFADYYREHGQHCWELDALDPRTLENLVTTEIDKILDPEPFYALMKKQERERVILKKVSRNWKSVQAFTNKIKEKGANKREASKKT